VITSHSAGRAIGDPGLGVNYAMVVHGEQKFEYSRALVAGDVVTARVTIADIRDAGRNALITTETEIRAADGEHICTGYTTLVERGGAASQQDGEAS
jgi:acyl dehydratase